MTTHARKRFQWVGVRCGVKRRMTEPVLAFLVLAVAGASLPDVVVAQTSGIITGTVTDVRGEPLEGVAVTLDSPWGGIEARGSTGATGRYWIAGVTAGSGYRLVGARLGLAKTSRSGLTVAIGDTLVVDFEMNDLPIELDPLTVSMRQDPLLKYRAPVMAAEIAAAEGMISAQDIFRMLRPNAIGARVPQCSSEPLKVYIDGVRRDVPLDTMALIHRRGTLFERQRIARLLSDIPVHLKKLIFAPRPADDSNGAGLAEAERLRASTKTQSNLYAVWLTLGRIPAAEIVSVEMRDCADTRVPPHARNSIWITTKRGIQEEGW